MADSLDIEAEVQRAKEQGYFDLRQLKGRYSLEDLRALYKALDRKGIPREPPGQARAREEDEAVHSAINQLDDLDQRTALGIINALRTGTVPPCDLTPLSVGRQALRQQMVEDLDEVGRGSARVRFLDAAYGAGKTHTLRLLAESAYRQGFAVSLVTLSPRECPLNSLLAVYGAIVNGISTSESREESGLQQVLDCWIDIIRRDGPDVAQQRIQRLAPHMVTVLAEYAGARVNPVRGNPQRQITLLNYLSGKRVARRELTSLGIAYVIDEASALAALHEITMLVRQLGFRGLCIFLDEAESVLSFSRLQQLDKAYDNLGRIVESGADLSHCYFIYAATPTFFENYAVYWSHHSLIDPAHVYELPSLSTEELCELAERIARIYSNAYQSPLETQWLRQIVEPLAAEVGAVGMFVRGFVTILDRRRRGG
jgi:hypothetical protein